MEPDTVQIGVQAVPLAGICAVALSAALTHVHVYLRRRGSTADLLFACCCLLIAVYAGGFAAQLCLTDPVLVVLSDYVQILAVTLFAPCLIWFAHIYTGRPANRFVRVITGCYAVVFLVSLLGPLSWTVLPGCRVGMLPNVPFGSPAPFREVTLGPLGEVQVLLVAVGIPYLLGLSIWFLKQKRQARSYLLMASVAAVCLAGAHDIAVIEGWILSMYCAVYSFLLVVVLMGHALVLDVAEAAQLKDVLKEKNESIQLALEGGRLAFWDWFPGSNGLRVRHVQEPSTSVGASQGAAGENVLPTTDTGFREATEPCFRSQQDRFDVEVRIGACRWVLIQGKVFDRDEEKRPVRISGTTVDITQTKKLQEAKVESERRALALLDGVSSYLLICVYDLGGRPRLIRCGWMDCGDGAGKDVSSVYEIEPSLTRSVWHQRLNATEQGCSFSYQTEYQDFRGRRIPVDARASRIEWAGETMLLVIARDISSYRLTEQRLNEAAEAERQKFGVELHDGMGQYLTAISYRSRLLLKRTRDGQPCSLADMEELVKLSSLLTQETRLLARRFDAVHLVERGLESAVEELLQFNRKHFDAECHLDWDQSFKPMDKTQEVHVYRFLQEALNNAFKHGEARRVVVRCGARDTMAYVSVENEGRMWNPGSEGRQGMGLRTMQRRALLLGGTLIVAPRLEGGTRLTCTFPVKHKGG